MMKIRKAENLNSNRDISTNVTIPEEVRLNYSDLMRLQNLPAKQDSYAKSLAFRGKKQIIKPVIDGIKKTADKETWMHRIFKSGFFDGTLDLMKHEVFVQAAISCLICVGLRPATIMALPNNKDKKDNMYAAGHSVSSGLVGLLASFLIATPFSKGAKYMQKNMINELDTKILKRMYPNVDLNSIWKDGSKTIRKPVEEWLDVQGNKFSTEFKNVLKVARPKHITQVSEETLKTLGADVDMKAMNGKSINEWVDRSGKKIHLELKDMFIKVKEDGMGENYFSLQHIDENFLGELFPQLNIKSITTKDGKRLHTDFWKNTDGSKFNLDMDLVHVSSFRETVDAMPLYTGRTRIDSKTKQLKYTSYQTNNGIKDKTRVPEKLGSEIPQSWLDADARNDIQFKLLTWFPDIITRPIVAASTIELLPIILKHVFHLEKSKKKEEPSQEPLKQESAVVEARVENNLVADADKQPSTNFKGRKVSNNNPSFKGGLGNWIGKKYAKYYALPLTNKGWVHDLAEKFTKIPGSMTEHMATLGSAITSSVYMARTLGNKDLDDDKKKTLAVNQGLCFVIPTICAYWVNSKLAAFNKKAEYLYSGIQEGKIASGKLTQKQMDVLDKELGNRLKGFKVLASLFTFTLIYRYITPVAITPIANWIGDKLNAKNKPAKTADKSKIA